ncbi:MAG: toxin-antitoxin system YwqK family antitoxin [Candidatus Neomarinimicrobiota bacterium]|tara:strand:- start:625 stop:1008 length:384 start_codon:yes stop_codon:yes gene_type:complete
MKKIFIISITFLSGQNIYFVNNLIEKNENFYNYMNDSFLSGLLYFNYIDEEENAKKLFVGEIKNGIKNGLWTHYWDNGNKKEEGLYKDSFKEGLWIEWFKTGDKYLEILYKRDSIIHFTNCVIGNCN